MHDVLASHPQLRASPMKKATYFLTDRTRPSRAEHHGRGDAHSARERIWRRERHDRLFADAPSATLQFESRPFYLWQRTSRAHIVRVLPEAKLIAFIRDPADRAFSNWRHLRTDWRRCGPSHD